MLRHKVFSVALVLTIVQVGYSQFGRDPTDPEVPLGFSGRIPDPFGVAPLGVQSFGGAAVQAARSDTELAERLDALQSFLQADSQDPSRNKTVKIDGSITHQPLIHVKVRVIEVVRADGLAISSVLDFITNTGGTSPFGTAPFDNTINSSARRLAGINRLPVPGLLDVAGNGTGMLINLSSAHVNWVASLLATELNGDIITAPQVTTLNGKNVIFRAGSKVPFTLGQNTITGDTNNIQEFFYKHVGTFISVTPQIVRWGNEHERLGKLNPKYHTLKNLSFIEFFPEDIVEPFTALAQLVSNRRLVQHVSAEYQRSVLERLNDGVLDSKEYEELLPTTLQELNKLLAIEGFDRALLARELRGSVRVPTQPSAPPCLDCDWKPSECTINLNIAVRLSDVGSTPTSVVDAEGDIVEGSLTSEQNVRAISNVVQVKSGHGVVIGGLINMRDEEQVSKVPFVGDLPVIGAALRSKTTERTKIETLIFVEAEVLPSFECSDECGNSLAKAKTADDFCNGKVHVWGPICDGPLAAGMHRAGLQGDYLPRPSHGEREYWHYYHHTMRHQRHHRLTSQLKDTFNH